MRIFILEDMPERQKLFKKKFCSCELVIIDNAKDAIEFLKKDLNFDLMLLDHDLGLRVFVDSNDENTGVQVAKFLSNKKLSCDIIIHSLNYAGAMNMLAYLPNAKYIPFSLFTERMSINE